MTCSLLLHEKTAVCARAEWLAETFARGGACQSLCCLAAGSELSAAPLDKPSAGHLQAPLD